jgi:uncharacterized protein YbjQ (UPF0145 family)
MSISTSDLYDLQKYEVKALVTATHTEGLSLARGFIAEIGGLFGGKSDLMNKKVNDVMNMLIQKLQKQIQSGERIIGVSFEFAEFGRSEGNTFLSGIATGTIISPKMTGGKRKATRVKAKAIARRRVTRKQK